MAEKKRRRNNRKKKAKGRRVPHPNAYEERPALAEMEGRGKKRMPTMAERSERERTALERLRDLNNQEW